MFVWVLTLLFFAYFEIECKFIKNASVHRFMSFSYLSISGSILPATVVQAEGLDATFLCQLPASNGAIEWQVNGTSLRNMNYSGGWI